MYFYRIALQHDIAMLNVAIYNIAAYYEEPIWWLSAVGAGAPVCWPLSPSPSPRARLWSDAAATAEGEARDVHRPAERLC